MLLPMLQIDSALGDSMQESATDKYGGGGDGLLDKAWDDMQMKVRRILTLHMC